MTSLKLKTITLKRKTKKFLSSFGLGRFFKTNKGDLDKKLVYSLSPRKIPNGRQFKHLSKYLNPKEYLIVKICIILILVNVVYLGIMFVKKHLEYIPVAGGTYVEGVIGYPKTINPIYSSNRDIDGDLSRLIYSSLFTYNANGELVKDLATDLKVEAEGKEYIIRIHDNAYWHNGEKLTADDIIFTFNLIKDEEYRSPLRHSLLGVRAEMIDEQTLKFVLSETYAPFPELLTFGILPQRIWENIDSNAAVLSELNLKPVGSGPYKFKTLIKNRNGYLKDYNLVVNEEYYREKPYLKNITFRFFVNYPEAIEALNDNQVDALSYLPLIERKELLAQNSLFLHELSLPQIVSVFFNGTKNEKLAEKKIRQALAMAIDKDKLLTDAYDDIYKRADSPVLENSFAYKEDVNKTLYNKEEAKKLLGENALEISLSVVDVNGNVSFAEKLKKYWEEIGVKVNLKTVPSNQASETIKNRDFEVLIYGQNLGGDPDIYAFWHSSQANAKGLNLASYNNEDVDKLLVEARRSLNEEDRITKYKQIQEKIVSDMSVIFLYSPTYTYVQSKKTKGFVGTAIVEPADRWASVSSWYKRTKKKLVW